MHIPDGILPAQVCVGGYAVTGLMTWYTLRRIRRTSDPAEEIPKASLLAAAFFVGSSISIPIPPASVHLVLNGLLGAMLGYYAVPAILVGLFLQAVLIGHGGITTLGVNAAMMGIPALLAARVFQFRHQLDKRLAAPQAIGLSAFLAGALGIGLSTVVFFSLIIFTLPSDLNAATEGRALTGLMLSHIPIVLMEGVFTALLALFLRRVKPELLESRG